VFANFAALYTMPAAGKRRLPDVQGRKRPEGRFFSLADYREKAPSDPQGRFCPNAS
jgi:hypothetical protein